MLLVRQVRKECRFKLSGKARTFTKGGTGKGKGGKNDKNVNAVAAEADKRVVCLECADESWFFMTYEEPDLEHWRWTCQENYDVEDMYLDSARLEHVPSPDRTRPCRAARISQARFGRLTVPR